ncbi:hypothetical protein RJ639_017412 [Escallonia herrerae]|uniref:Uncharacterized protein n=1 Tax=Escallonia herrerae TaxID=1293975 RepID=A0AA88VDW9_9ASTE|nr:hypothetical protein RJ639_017412 [Escallonia herrerae]
MGSFSSESRSRSRVYRSSTQEESNLPHLEFPEYSEEEANENPSTGLFRNEDSWSKSKTKMKKNQVCLEGYVESASDDDELGRTKSLTDEDLDELKGCLDLGFGFSYEEIPELCNTLPALELCYSMSQKFLDEQQKSPESPKSVPETCSPPPGPIANWKISSPGDHPEDVKARLKFWAQAVAFTVRLCS